MVARAGLPDWVTNLTGPGAFASLTHIEARAHIARCLREAGVADAALDARIFVEEASGLDRTALIRAGGVPIGGVAAERLRLWLARRLAGEPVWRIVGQREFWGLPFAVTPAVLDPRPDTETLVSAALTALGDRRASPLFVLDLGIGSGAILASLLTECPLAEGIGVDRSRPACDVARRNLTALGLSSRSLVVNGSWADAIADSRFDLVVSNPPYIETSVIPTLDREVREHDPHFALDGGSDGLDCYRVIASALPRLLRSGGVTVLEVGAGQARSVQGLLDRAGLRHETTRSDLGGRPRAVVARKA
ncbi:peptide chain release factor N(5)-glutamine methyltransferase [Lichenifustis flavocetrariae]|uniref:Release factor glutamine methyltransferase n=1 Tax=Lichenifustis flavocetrariae TaxID=2949735 RepID=A0AA41YZT0_9HYPH|nr:peptide chain release factor N(5)-glutamine methyltransferase [Lichenifustis flavocetrariae]MCW6507913.1 peptide chain release factor N(5)-glutamine methyltransferase [Lichenifustis flavocetrariae]